MGDKQNVTEDMVFGILYAVFNFSVEHSIQDANKHIYPTLDSKLENKNKMLIFYKLYIGHFNTPYGSYFDTKADVGNTKLCSSVQLNDVFFLNPIRKKSIH